MSVTNSQISKDQPNPTLNQEGIDLLFLNARSYNDWQETDVTDAQLKQIYDWMKMAPTSANCSPARIVFVRSAEAKARLLPTLMEGNVEKTKSAPVTAIIAHDMKFYDHLPKLFPHTDAKSWFEGNDALTEETAMRNGTLQGAYFMMAVRAAGLDCGPMSGFDADRVNEEFFKGTDFKANFLCNIGVGDRTSLFGRSPRFAFDEVCQVL